MPVKQTIPYPHGVFFITFTCHRWLCLIQLIQGYDLIYNWFDILKKGGHYIHGYVIMPNHVHVLISFTETEQSINAIIGNGKRFIGYEIINRLRLQGETDILLQLKRDVKPARRMTNHQHIIWEKSFDWKECNNPFFVNQKLDYMHSNPCEGKWNLCKELWEYKYSSAAFYINNDKRGYPVTNVAEIDDIIFTTRSQ